MKLNTLLTITVSLVVLLGTGAALAGAVPGQAAPTNDTPNETAPGQSGEAANTTGLSAANASVGNATDVSPGPEDGLPPQVPDHVSQIHDTIEAFLGGTLDMLGNALSELLTPF